MTTKRSDKIDYTLDQKGQLGLIKLSLVELSQYWRLRSKKLIGSSSVANIVAIELADCADQLDRILAGEPTEADGFKI